MTINTQNNKSIVLGNGSQTQFAFGFIGVAAAFISVIFTDADGNETVLARGSGTSQYQIVLNSPVQGAIWGVGGTVTYNPSGTPIAAGTSLTISRTLPLTQAISLQNLISLSTVSNGAEMGLDTLEMQLQQVSETFSRAIVAPIVDPDTIDLTLPAAAQRANLVLGFDGDGNVIAAAAPTSGVISSAMQPVVNAASLAAGRSAFGLGAMAVEGIGAGLQDDGSGNARVNSVIQEVASNQAIHAANHLDIYVASGALVFTLDRANTLFDGFTITIYALTAAITVVPNASDNFTGQTSGASFTVPLGCVAKMSTDGAVSGLWISDVTGFNRVEPTSTILTSGSGTYTTKAGCTRLNIRMLGGSGGSGGAGNSPTSGGNGETTTFGTVNANAGAGGTGLSGNGVSIGGQGGASGSGAATLRIPGGNGGGGGSGTGYATSGAGGISAFGGAAPSQCGPTGTVLTGLAPSANSGSGASGGVVGGQGAGGGGGAGEYVELNIIGPNPTYNFTVGAAGAAGTAAGGSGPGNVGSVGIIIIDEFYN
jgi:hypothetical protein